MHVTYSLCLHCSSEGSSGAEIRLESPTLGQGHEDAVLSSKSVSIIRMLGIVKPLRSHKLSSTDGKPQRTVKEKKERRTPADGKCSAR